MIGRALILMALVAETTAVGTLLAAKNSVANDLLELQHMIEESMHVVTRDKFKATFEQQQAVAARKLDSWEKNLATHKETMKPEDYMQTIMVHLPATMEVMAFVNQEPMEGSEVAWLRNMRMLNNHLDALTHLVQHQGDAKNIADVLKKDEQNMRQCGQNDRACEMRQIAATMKDAKDFLGQGQMILGYANMLMRLNEHKDAVKGSEDSQARQQEMTKKLMEDLMTGEQLGEGAIFKNMGKVLKEQSIEVNDFIATMNEEEFLNWTEEIFKQTVASFTQVQEKTSQVMDMLTSTDLMNSVMSAVTDLQKQFTNVDMEKMDPTKLMASLANSPIVQKVQEQAKKMEQASSAKPSRAAIKEAEKNFPIGSFHKEVQEHLGGYRSDVSMDSVASAA